MRLVEQVFDPSTFLGSVFAAAVGVGVVSLLAYASQLIHGWWLAVTQFELWPWNASSTVDPIWDEPESLRDGRPIAKKAKRDHLVLALSSKKDWSGGPLEIVFVTLRIPWLPAWVPLNVRNERPRISCRSVDIDPKFGGNFSIGSSGYLYEKAGAFRGEILLSKSAIVPAGHQVEVSILYEARLSFSGLVAVRVRIDRRWLSAYYPVVVSLVDEQSTT